MSVKSNPETMQITAADVALGYVDPPQHSRIDIQSNSSDAFALEFHGSDASGVIREVEVSGAGREARIGASGGVIMLACVSRPGVAQAIELRNRVHLTQNAQPGTYRSGHRPLKAELLIQSLRPVMAGWKSSLTAAS